MRYRSTIIIFLLCLLVGTVSAWLDTPPKLRPIEALGKQLFEEKILSADSSVSCASCHKPAFAFADTSAFSVGIRGQLGTRNTPSVLNMKNRPYFFWDGRATSLAEQALKPIENPEEMGLPIAEAVKRLDEHPTYRRRFLAVFGQRPTAKNLAQALAAFESTLETVNSKFDDWSNNLRKLTPMEEAGRELFVGDKAKCFNCHSMEDFTDDDFKNIGLFDGKTWNDSGRIKITGKASDLGKFKTPGLRNVAVTAPYMHNGMFRTLEEVVAYYNNPQAFVSHPLHIDPDLAQPLNLTDLEQKQLVAFMHTLTDKAYLPRVKKVPARALTKK